MQQTLPKSSILRGYQSFSRVISQGFVLQGAVLTAYVEVVRTETAGGAVIGFAVAKKRVPLAVRRNRIRRLMREAVRKGFRAVQDSAEAKSEQVSVVLSYKGKPGTDPRRMTLSVIEPDWTALRARILEKL